MSVASPSVVDFGFNASFNIAPPAAAEFLKS